MKVNSFGAEGSGNADLAQRIESRIYFEQGDQRRAEINSFLQSAGCFILFSEAGVDEGGTESPRRVEYAERRS